MAAREASLPSVVCRTATFGRGPLLNEAVESFLLQDYPGPKRMFEADIWNAVSLSLIFGPLAA